MRKFGYFCKVMALIGSLLGMGCAGKEPYPSVSSILENWLEIKLDLSSMEEPEDGAERAAGALESRLDAFGETLSRFFASPVGSLYTIHRPGEMRSLASLASVAERLKKTARSRDAAEILHLTGEVDAALDLLRRIDIDLLETSQINSFRLFFFFSALIIIIIAALKVLYSRLEKTEIRERGSLAFSRENLLAQEEERARIARELHDTVAQDLWRLSFQTDSILKAADGEEQKRLCAEAVAGQKELMRRVRAICDDLIPPDFERRGLIHALNLLCYNFEKRAGISCRVMAPEELLLESLDSGRQLQCFRIVQECLANIEKHSLAEEASVFVRPGGGALLICVSDNGRGFSAPDREASRALREEGHFGLWSMYERAASLDALLTIESSSAEGTTVNLEIPLWEGGLEK